MTVPETYSDTIIKPLRILIGCEESQAVTKAFRALGHEAYSNDIKECSGGKSEWHLKMDVMEAIDLKKWDFIGLHPVCTKMTLSGNRHYAPGKPKHNERIQAVEWTIKLWQIAIANAKHVYMENPMGTMNGDKRLPKPQIVQPYYFGDQFQKTTCLWLYGLKPLLHVSADNLFESRTHVGKGEFYISPKTGKKLPSWYGDPVGEDGKKIPYNTDLIKTIRSKTFPGLANAMASQWSQYLTGQPTHSGICKQI